MCSSSRTVLLFRVDFERSSGDKLKHEEDERRGSEKRFRLAAVMEARVGGERPTRSIFLLKVLKSAQIIGKTVEELDKVGSETLEGNSRQD